MDNSRGELNVEMVVYLWKCLIYEQASHITWVVVIEVYVHSECYRIFTCLFKEKRIIYVDRRLG